MSEPLGLAPLLQLDDPAVKRRRINIFSSGPHFHDEFLVLDRIETPFAAAIFPAKGFIAETDTMKSETLGLRALASLAFLFFFLLVFLMALRSSRFYLSWN